MLGVTAASPLNNDPFLGASRGGELHSAPALIFVEAQLWPDLIDPGSVFFEADGLMLTYEAPHSRKHHFSPIQGDSFISEHFKKELFMGVRG